MCRKKGRRCPSHSNPEKRKERNARRRAKYQADKNPQSANPKPVETLQEDTIKRELVSNQPHQEGFTPSSVSPKDITFALKELNTSGDMYYDPKTLQMGMEGKDSFIVRLKNFDSVKYEFHVSKDAEKGGVLAFKSYDQDDDFDDDDDEMITEARPCVYIPYNEFHTEAYASSDGENIALNMLDMVEKMDDPEKDWNKDEYAAKFLYFGEAHYDINSALRNKTELNPQLVKTLDGIMSQDTLKKETIVYRGIRGNDALVKKVRSGKYRDLGYLSTTTDKGIAESFSGKHEKSIVMKLRLPAGTVCHNASNDSEKEITLPRNFDLSKAQWEFFDQE